HARDLDPTWGRFLTPDPVVSDPTDAQAYNRYAYARNNPFRYTDPTGYFETADMFGDPASDKDNDTIVDDFYEVDYETDARAPVPADPPNLVARTTGADEAVPPPAWYHAGTVETPPAHPHTGRHVGIVYVTGHRFAHIGPYHTAIEYTNELGQARWVSAGPQGGNLVSGQGGAFGVGVYKAERATDRPGKNATLGTVTPPVGEAPGAYFERIRAADAAYCDCIGYPLDGGYFSGAQNSNSYTRGLIEGTGGTTAVDFGEYTSGNNPVSDWYFK
ncbi:MAG: hypothetical protein HYV02_00330, partial [Deltaproteobacteria bacterium]|nr:hypothetical protein [Deltaproteobacteria bacterium]